MKVAKTTKALCLVLAAGFANAAPINYISNGGFESGLTSWFTSSTNSIVGSCDQGWVVGNSGSASGCTGIAPYNQFVNPQSGSAAAYNSFDGDGPQTIRLFQTFNYTAANAASGAILDWYDAVGFGLGGNFPQARVFNVDVTINGQLFNVFSESFGNNGQGLFQTWQQTSLNLTDLFDNYGAGTHTVTLAFSNYVPQYFTGPGAFGLDNVRLLIDTASIQAVPEPATLSILGLGLAGLAFSRRRIKA